MKRMRPSRSGVKKMIFTRLLFYSVFSRCPCYFHGRISPVKISLTPALSSPSSSYSSSLALALQGLIFLIVSPNRLDYAAYFLHLGCCICFLYCYNHLINFLFSLFISLANLDSSAIMASATARSSPTASYAFITFLFFLRSYVLEFFISSRSIYYFVYFLHGVCYVSWLYYYVVKDGRLFNFLSAIRILYDHPVILTPNATDQSASSQRARNYNVDLTHALSNGTTLVKISIVLSIRTRSGISLESHSSQHPVSLIPAATDQSASNRRALNCNVDLLSNQFDSTQPPALSELQVDVVSISNSSELQGNAVLSRVNQFASSSSQLQTNQLAPRDWAALDHGVLSEIVERLPTDEDFLSFKEVCCWCRFICSGMNWTTSPQIPWLMLSERVDSNMRSFYSFDKNKHYEIELPAALRRRCFASPHGWITTVGPDGKIHLLNPLSQDQKMLPPLGASNRISALAAGDWFRFIHKLMVFKSSPNEFIVMAIYGRKKHLAFVRFGERKWNTIRNAFDFRDVALFKGQFYALRAFGTLVRIEFRDVAKAIFVALSPEDSGIHSAVEAYLVKSSSGDLLGVFRYGFKLEMRRETEYFWVYKFDFETEEWVRMEELGDCALFVGEGNSWSIRATNAKHSNRIYYADDYWKRQRPGEVTLNGHDIGVFSMESGEIELLNFGMDLPYEFSRPIWYTPTLRSKFFQY